MVWRRGTDVETGQEKESRQDLAASGDATPEAN